MEIEVRQRNYCSGCGAERRNQLRKCNPVAQLQVTLKRRNMNMKRTFWASLMKCTNLYVSKLKQNSIPVGCVPPASVATTRCQLLGYTFKGVVPGIPTSPEGPWDQAYPPTPSCGQTDTFYC